MHIDKAIIRQLISEALAETPPTERFLDIQAVCRRYGRSKATIGRWQAQGLIPAPEYIGNGRAWRESVLIEAEASGLVTTTPQHQVGAAQEES